MSNEPIAYTYEADYHCPDCAEKRFGRSADGFIAEDTEDNEENLVGIVSPWDEWWDNTDECDVLSCGDCHAVLDNAHRDECENQNGDEPCTISEEYLV